jgi:hypothetical protein
MFSDVRSTTNLVVARRSLTASVVLRFDRATPAKHHKYFATCLVEMSQRDSPQVPPCPQRASQAATPSSQSAATTASWSSQMEMALVRASVP